MMILSFDLYFFFFIECGFTHAATMLFLHLIHPSVLDL